MICFGAKTDQEVKENVTYVSHKKNKIKIKIKIKRGRRRTGRESVRERMFLIFFLLLLLSSIYGNRIVGIRRAKKAKCSIRRGLRMGTKNTGFHRVF